MNTKRIKQIITSRQAFHVHTSQVPDEAYIKKAISLKLSDIWFTDYAPFPGDPFLNRMKHDQLPEYIHSLMNLKEQYQNDINVHIGLEIEYFYQYEEYYSYLLESGIEMLLLGQHIYQTSKDNYNFSLPDTERKQSEMQGLGRAIIEGIGTGLFKACAHLDRIFRYHVWDKEAEDISRDISDAALKYDVALEKNIESAETPNCYNSRFWDTVSRKNKIILGIDAHSPEELEKATPKEVVRIFRKANNLSQSEMSSRTGIPVATIRDWEQGRRVPPEYVVNMVLKEL